MTTRETARPAFPSPLSRRDLLALGAGAAGVALTAAPPERVHAAGRPVIVTTTAHVADLVRAVTGDGPDVQALLGEGIDPHSYKLTRNDTARLMAADAVFYNGLLLEGKMTDALVRVAGSGKPVHAISEFIPEEKLLSPPEFEGQYDPHVWMDVSLWRTALDGLMTRLSALYPDWAAVFTAQAQAHGSRLDALHSYAGTILSSVPADRRVLVTAHDAFGYLGRAYGVEVVGIQGLSTESEAGLRRVEELVAMLVDRKIPAVFVETSVTDRNIRALVEGAAARGHTVAIGGSLFSDAMGTPGTREGTYVGMMDHNVSTIARALGGTVPSGGFGT
jgi:manganese/zinc/iron transport system substrate-binding protein